jgi:ZIP family zinc transporter
MRRAGRSAAYALGLWGAVTLFLDGASGNVVAFIQSFAAGAVLTMLASTMMPEAYEDGGPVVGVVTTVGFLLAFILSRVA